MNTRFPEAKTFFACQRCSRPSLVSKQTQSTSFRSSSIVGTIRTPIFFISAVYAG